MSKTSEEFATWFYRAVIGALCFLTFLFVQSNYNDFNEMKKERFETKQELKDHEVRLTKIEEWKQQSTF